MRSTESFPSALPTHIKANPLDVVRDAPPVMEIFAAYRSGNLAEQLDASNFRPSYDEAYTTLQNLEHNEILSFLEKVLLIFAARKENLKQVLEGSEASRERRERITRRIRILGWSIDTMKHLLEQDPVNTELLDIRFQHASQLIYDLGILLNDPEHEAELSDAWLPEYNTRDNFEALLNAHVSRPSQVPTPEDFSISPEELAAECRNLEHYLTTAPNRSLAGINKPKTLPVNKA